MISTHLFTFFEKQNESNSRVELTKPSLSFISFNLGILNQRKIWPYLLVLGWGLPLPIVLISSSVKQADYVGNNTGRCWISSESGLIWSFLGPVYLILFINAIILISSAIRIGTARKQLSALRKFRGVFLSAIILTPILGLPWIVSLAKFVTLHIHNITAYQVLDTFVDWVFICLNAPSGVIFFFIILNRFREFRKSSKKRHSSHSQHLTSVSGVNNYRTRDGVPRTYRLPRARIPLSRGTISISSEKPDAKEFASNIITKSEQIDHDKNAIPDGKPLRPRLPKPQKPLPPKHSQEDDIFTYENNMTENPLYVPIEDISKCTTANGYDNKAASVEENYNQNSGNVEQGSILTKNNLVEEGLAIPNPLYNPIEPIDIDVPLTSHHSSPKTSFQTSPVSQHKLSRDKHQNAAAYVNPGVELDGEIDENVSPFTLKDDLSRVSPTIEREPEGFIRRSLNKIRSSLKMKPIGSNEPMASPITAPHPLQPSVEALPKPNVNFYQNMYLEHLHNIYSTKSQHVPKNSESKLNLLSEVQENPKPDSQSELSKVYIPKRGIKVSALKDKFDRPGVANESKRPVLLIKSKKIEMSTIDSKSENSSKRDSIHSSTSECEIPVSQSPSAKFPPGNHNMSTSFTQATTTPEKSISPSNTSEEHPHDSNEKVPETHYEFEDNFTTSPTPSDALESASNSSATSSPIKSVAYTYPQQEEKLSNPSIVTEIPTIRREQAEPVVRSKSATPTKIRLIHKPSKSSDTSSTIYSTVERKQSIIRSTSVEVLTPLPTPLKQATASKVLDPDDKITLQEQDKSTTNSSTSSLAKPFEHLPSSNDSSEVSTTENRKTVAITPTKEVLIQSVAHSKAIDHSQVKSTLPVSPMLSNSLSSEKSSPTKIIVRPLAKPEQSDSLETKTSTKSPPAPESKLTRPISSTSSNDKDTNLLDSSPISFTYQPPTDVTKVVTSKKTTFSTSHSVDQSLPEDVPKLKESECVSPPSIKPNPTPLKITDRPGAFSLPRRPLNTDKSGAQPSIYKPKSSESFPHPKRSSSRVSDKISFFEGTKTLPRSARASYSNVNSISGWQGSTSPLKDLDMSSPSSTKMTQSKSMNTLSQNTLESKPMSPFNVMSSQEIERIDGETSKKDKSRKNSEVFQTEL